MPAIIKVAKMAGEFIKEERKKFSIDDVEYKGHNDMVSYVDKEAEKMIIDGLGGIFNEASFIAEEGTTERTMKKHTWIIDPLDGTTNFIHGVPFYSVSIGLMTDGKLHAGVIYEPNSGDTYAGEIGDKAYKNDDVISVSEKEEIKESLLATGFPFYKFNKIDDYLEILHHFMNQSHGLRRMGSAALDLAYVATGQFQGFFEYNLKPWDVAAGAVIVQCAGGKITDFKGGDDYLFGKELIAAGGVHEKMLKVINQLWYK